MGINFRLQEGADLCGFLADMTTDIVVRTDSRGFIVHASPAIEQLDISPSDLLVGPHILDLVAPPWVPAIKLEYDKAMGRRGASEWIEFKAAGLVEQERWFAMKIRHLKEDDRSAAGALVVMRSIDERKSLEAHVFAASFTDQLTGLTNRTAFTFMLEHLLESGTSGCLALFEIDQFNMLDMSLGWATADKLIVAFSKFLRNNLRSDDIISRIGSDRFAVLLPDTPMGRAKALANNALGALAKLSKPSPAAGVCLTASCGIVPIADSVDTTTAKAGKALVLAKAKGRSSIETIAG